MQPYHPQTSTPTTKTPTVSSSSSTSENKDPNNLPKNSLSFTSLSHYLQTHILVHFLPARYPHSVAPGYAAFATASFAASVAGSAAMVLSTQTLLLAVGVVGASSSGVMAGALNWVLKDGIGQLGGVLFASLVGQFKSLDSHPKQWRVWSAASLDLANGMDICAPVVAATSGAVLPWACASNVLKNIGFLTTSASKAALHQTLASTGNLADITAKAGTQAMMAGLLGTTVGIALSSTVLQNDPTNFMMGFVGLSIVHQSCNYLSLRYVPLPYFNRQRLDILLHAYFLADESMHDTTNSQSTAANHPDTNTRHSPTILTPAQVALREEYFGHDRASASTSWLHLGSTVTDLAPSGAHDWETVIQRAQSYNDQYVINVVTDPTNNDAATDHFWQVHVTFLEHASGMDLLRGVFHAHLIQQEHHQQQQQQQQQQHARNTNTNDNSLTKESTQSYNHEIIDQTRQAMGERNALFDTFLEDVQQAGWSTDTDVTTIEPYNAVRLSLSSRPRSE